MSAATPDATEERSIVVVGDALAARQWELHLSAADLHDRRSAWQSPPITTYGNWLETLWLATSDTAAMPLTPGQSLALWRRVIAESRYGAELVGDAVAVWAAQAWNLLLRWRIDVAHERAAPTDLDYQAFLRWRRSYREQLDANDWLDRSELEEKLAAAPLEPLGRVVLADLDESYPARDALLANLERTGTRIETRAAPQVQCEPYAARLPDAATELRAAFAWAERRFRAAPDARFAIVVAGLGARRAEVDALLTTAADAGIPAWSTGSTLAADPAIGAALVGLALLGPSAPYATFGRWLRSEFFAADETEKSRRALLDAELRSDLRSQPPFLAAYRECGVAQLLEQRIPATAAALSQAFAAIGNRTIATPGYWAHAWTRALAALGWRPPLRTAALLGWQAALDSLARLTPILGDVSFGTALRELERALESPEPTAPPVRGIHVLGHIDEVGPGYAGVWATGFTDTYWPEGARGNPLLPRALQRAAAMPRATPQLARAAANRSFSRLLGRTAELVASWPARVYDYETEPSPAIRAWPLRTIDEEPRGARSATAERETVDDIPPALVGNALVGGASLLGSQARCPLRAFCQYRLGARELEALRFGVTGRLRGIAIHRAAQALYTEARDQVALAALTHDAIESAIELALRETFRSTRDSLLTLYELEAERLRSLLAALLQREAARDPFEVLAVEQAQTARIGEWTLKVRVDRLDRLTDGSIAVLDYKTGERVKSSDWFAPRLRDAQVPLYATQAPTAVGAAILVKVGASATSYLGVWNGTAFPGKPTRPPTDSWHDLVAHWRAQLEALAVEFARGDTRIFIADRDDADGIYAPLTRIHEQIGLLHGAVTPW